MIVKETGVIVSRFFTYKGVDFEVIATENEPKERIWKAVDTIKNIDSGKCSKMTRKGLYNLQKK